MDDSIEIPIVSASSALKMYDGLLQEDTSEQIRQLNIC